MTRAEMALRSVRVMWWTVAFVAFVAGAVATGQEPIKPTFKAGVDLVTVRAVVRDGKGRPVTNLEQRDFTLLDRGVARPITSFDRERSGVGVALLFDVSGSMDLASRNERARELAFFLLANLRDGEDEAAIYAFDSTLHLVQPFTTDLTALKGRLSTVSPWGVTSLHDAIAATAAVDGRDEQERRDQAPGARRAHRRGRQREQAGTGRGVAHRERDRRARLHRRRRAADRPAGRERPPRTAGRCAAGRQPRGPGAVDRRAAVLDDRAGAVERGGAADPRGSAAPVPDCVRAGQ